ncbi:hypothetical protein Tco_0599627 [Tanacetum coccineum]
MRPNTATGKDHNITIKDKKGVKEESEEEFEEETEEETEEEEEEDPEYFDAFPTGHYSDQDTTGVIDHYLLGMVLGRPFVKEIGFVYDKDEGTVTFEKEGEKIIFKMPHKMERFKHIDKDILKTDNIPSFIMTGDDGNQKNTHYSESPNLGLAYQRDKSVTMAIQSLIMIKSKKDEGGVT